MRTVADMDALPSADILDFTAHRARREAARRRVERAARSRYLLWYPGIGYVQQDSSVSQLPGGLPSGSRERG